MYLLSMKRIIMALPTLEYPTYEVKLTSRGKTKFRPFLVKEQKLLMMAVEGKDMENTIKTIKQIVSACVLDKIDVDALPMVDLELLFINLRARSMGEVMEVYYKCQNPVDDKPCGMIMEIPVNLLNIKVQEEKGLTNKIALSDTIGVGMHYPSFDLLDLLIHAKDNIDAEFVVVAGCIDYIYDKDNMHLAKDANPEELQQFVMNLPTEKYELLKNFILKAPKVRETVKKQCSKCSYDHTFTLEGLNDFFT